MGQGGQGELIGLLYKRIICDTPLLLHLSLGLRNQQPADGHGRDQADQNGLHYRDTGMRSEHARHNREERPADLGKDKNEGYRRGADLGREQSGADRDGLAGVSSAELGLEMM